MGLYLSSPLFLSQQEHFLNVHTVGLSWSHLIFLLSFNELYYLMFNAFETIVLYMYCVFFGSSLRNKTHGPIIKMQCFKKQQICNGKYTKILLEHRKRH